MSYVEMRKALEAVQGDLEEIGHLSASTGKQVDAALKSEITVSELVSELRKRDGVAIFEIEEYESFEIQTWFQMGRLRDYDSGQGTATILRITD